MKCVEAISERENMGFTGAVKRLSWKDIWSINQHERNSNKCINM